VGLVLDNSELKFNPKQPGHFKLVAQVDSSNRHSLSCVDGDKGHVSSKHIARNYKEYLSHQGNLKDGEKIQSLVLCRLGMVIMVSCMS
tara:strand:- start:522 stop:785 length:264 start_codon:yes stop_codon:yes gene_type:complete